LFFFFLFILFYSIFLAHGKIVVFLSGVPNYGVGSLVPINDQEKVKIN